MPDASTTAADYSGDGYEFSFRLDGGLRLFMHVTKSAIDQLRSRSVEQESQLAVVVRNMPALRAVALKHHLQEGISRVILTAADIAGP